MPSTIPLCILVMLAYASCGDIPAMADVILIAVAILLAFSATAVACSAVPPRKFPPAILSISPIASLTLPVILESMDAASLNFDPSFSRLFLNSPASFSGSRVLPVGLDVSTPPNGSLLLYSLYGISEDRSLWAIMPISSMFRPWLKSMLYPPFSLVPRL